MLAIARALMGRPRLLLLDEPSMGLSPMLVDQVFEKIQAIASAGTTILLVEQNARMALEIASLGLVLESGELILQGSGEDLLKSAGLRVEVTWLHSFEGKPLARLAEFLTRSFWPVRTILARKA